MASLPKDDNYIAVQGAINDVSGDVEPLKTSDVGGGLLVSQSGLFSTQFSNSPNIDAFGRLRVSTPLTLLDTKQTIDKLPLFYDDQEVSGTGTTSTYQTNKASTLLSVTSGSAGKRVRQSFLRGNYQPGKSMLVELTANLAENTPIKIGIRSKTSGSVVDTTVAQADFNIDKLDGTGASGITIDWSKSQIFYIDFEWLAVGAVTFGVVIDREVIWCHRVTNANHLDSDEVVYMQQPNLPVRYEIESDGASVITKRVGYFDNNSGIFFEQVGSNTNLYQICSTVISEGGQEQTAVSTYVSRNGTSQTLANQDLFTPIISIRLKSTHLCTRITPFQADVLATSAINFEWALFIAPTIAGTDQASWQSVTNSSLEYDISRDATNTISGGYQIAGGYGSSTNQSRIPIAQTNRAFLTIGSLIDGTPQELVLAVKNIDGNGGTVYGGLNINEYC